MLAAKHYSLTLDSNELGYDSQPSATYSTAISPTFQKNAMPKDLSTSSSEVRQPVHSPTQTRKSVSGNRALWSDFLKFHYKSIKEKNPDWSPRDIRAYVGKLWSNSPTNPKNRKQ
ncbi:hypothetical protein BGZ73_004786 [Actinomortierella ambigua]|nr:hypothetical protein BGZ73_004786 [Actinomortierella ambigua]